MASNIIAPQPIPSQSISLAEDIWKMWQSAAPFPQELAEKESSLKRALPFAAQMEPPAKRAPPPTQFAPQIPPQMHTNLAAQQQQFLQQQQAALQQALARGQLPTNFAAIPVSQAAMNGVPQIQIQTPQILAHLEKLQKEQQQMQQQQLQQQQLQQQQQMQQQMHQQQQLHQLMHQRAMQQQNGGIPGHMPGQMPPQMMQGQVVRAGPPHMMGLQPEQYAQLLKMNPQLLMNPQQAAQAQQQAQLQQAHSAPVGPQQQNILVPQMPGRRQTIGPATITPQMMGVIPRMHHPSPKLIPTSSPIPVHMLPSSSSATPAAKSPFAAPILPVRPPTAPTLIPAAKLSPPINLNTQHPATIPPGFLKGPDEPNYISFLNHCRVIEQQIHSMLGDGMVRMPQQQSTPTSTKESSS